MQSERAVASATPQTPRSMRPRVTALTALGAVLAAFFFFARSVYFASTDAWIAPIMLSSDNDQVLQINVKLNEQQVQREKLRIDIERIDADVRGIDQAVGRLQQIEGNARESLKWTAFTTKVQS